MAQRLDAAKRRVWIDRFRRFARCGLTVLDFCETEGVSAPCFYEWRRKLNPPSVRGASLAPRSSAQQAFLPVRIVAPSSAGATVEIHLANGVRVSLANADHQSMAAAIAAAAQVPGPAHDQEESV
jgi:hypothetical protein